MYAESVTDTTAHRGNGTADWYTLRCTNTRQHASCVPPHPAAAICHCRALHTRSSERYDDAPTLSPAGVRRLYAAQRGHPLPEDPRIAREPITCARCGRAWYDPTAYTAHICLTPAEHDAAMRK